MVSAYAEPLIDPTIPAPLTSADISTKVFAKAPDWFDRDVNRKRLYGKGFPRPFERGLWSAIAVRRWLETAGTAEQLGGPPKAVHKRRKPAKSDQPRPNGYAAVGRAH